MEAPSYHLIIREAESGCHGHPTGFHQGTVNELDVAGRHDSILCIIDGVENCRQRGTYFPWMVISVLDTLKDNGRSGRYPANQRLQVAVVDEETDDVDIEMATPCESESQACLSSSGRSVKQVAPPVWTAVLLS
jgi:hypothetical protein